jgi:polyisoprenoid-binding protein YceI
MQDDILETAAHPTIAYAASPTKTAVKPDGPNQYDVALTGDLTLHGTTRMQPVNARVLVHGDMLRASGEVPIQQTAFQLKVVRVPGSLLKIKDEVKLTFDIVARK